MIFFVFSFSVEQQVATALLIYIGRVFKLTSARGMDWKTSRRLLPLSLFYNANVAFALASLKGVNIPMYIALKRLTPLAVLVTGFFSGSSKPSTEVFTTLFFFFLFNMFPFIITALLWEACYKNIIMPTFRVLFRGGQRRNSRISFRFIISLNATRFSFLTKDVHCFCLCLIGFFSSLVSFLLNYQLIYKQ